MRGEAFDRSTERSGKWLPQARNDASVAPTAGDWGAAVFTAVLGAGLGYYLAQLVWFG